MYLSKSLLFLLIFGDNLIQPFLDSCDVLRHLGYLGLMVLLVSALLIVGVGLHSSVGVVSQIDQSLDVALEMLDLRVLLLDLHVMFITRSSKRTITRFR